MGKSSYRDGTRTYPFGTPYSDETSITNADLQQYKYNSKELDCMYGLDTYDYGARQYDPVLCRWDRIDPLCEKYYSVSPYVYCHNNPIDRVDPDGKDDYFTNTGKFLYSKGDGANIYIQQGKGFINFSCFNLKNKANMQVAAHIVGYYARAIGTEYSTEGGTRSIGINTLHSEDNKGRTLAATDPYTKNTYIKMTDGHLDSYMYNKWQLRGTIRHEYQHKLDFEKGDINAHTNLRHAEIVLIEMENPDFSKCSEEYKDLQKKQFRAKIQMARQEGFNDNLIQDLMNRYYKIK